MIDGEGAGKGDSPRPVNKKKYDDTLTRIFGERDVMEFHRDGPGKKGHPVKKGCNNFKVNAMCASMKSARPRAYCGDTPCKKFCGW